MDTEKFISNLEPIMKMATEANMWSKTITRHYVQEMSKLTGKSESELQEEIGVIFEKVKEETIQKIKKH